MAIIVPLKSVFDNSGINNATKSLKGFAKIAAATVGVAAVGSFLADSAKAATEDAKSQVMLERQLRATTGATTAQIGEVNKAIASMEQMSSVADDNIRPAFAQLTRATGDVGKATELTRLALDVSAGTGKELSTVTIALGKAYQGNTAGLAKLGINVKGLKDPMGALQKQFAGAAQTAANADPYQQMALALENIKESVGAALLPVLQQFAQWLVSVVPQIQDFFKQLLDPTTKVGAQWKVFSDIVSGLFIFITNNIGVLSTLAGALIVLQGVTRGAAIAQALFDVSLGAFNPVSLAIGIAVLGVAIGGIIWQSNDAATAITNLQKTTENAKFKPVTVEAQALADSASTVATAMSIVSQRLVDRNINPWFYMSDHSKEWNKAVDDEVARLNKFGDAQKLANAKAVITHQEGRATPIIKRPETVAAEAAAVADKAQKLKDAAKAAAQKLADAKKTLSGAVKDFVDSLKPAELLPRQVGVIEAGVVSSFAGINEKLKTAFDAGALTKTALANLQKFADGEQGLLARIAKQRDDIAIKISAAKDLILSTKDAFLSAFDVTALTPGAGMFDEFKTILDKTKTFYANLRKLQQMGLSKDLFAQVVAGGLDAGAATAQAIIDSGANGVASLNDTAAQLSDIAGGIGETAAQVAYGSGVDVSKGLIAGLLSQDTELVRVATLLGNSFKTAFTAGIKTGKLDVSQAMGEIASGNAMLNTSAGVAGTQISVTVNAGMGADGGSIAKTLVSTLKKYERTNGAIWAAA